MNVHFTLFLSFFYRGNHLYHCINFRQVKDIVHVWEVGPLTSSLLSAAMTGSALTHSPHHTTLLMMLNLTKPEVLWTTLEECLTVARSAIKMSFDDKTVTDLREQRVKEKRANHEAAEGEVDPFPMKLCIVGGRYDEFKVSSL